MSVSGYRNGAAVTSVGLSTLAGSIILLMALLNDRGKMPPMAKKTSYSQPFTKKSQQFKEDTFLEGSEWRFVNKDHDLTRCTDLLQLFKHVTPIGAGYTKSVFLTKLGGTSVAVKIINFEGAAFEKCIESSSSTADMCRDKLTQSIHRELFFLRQLSDTRQILRKKIIQLHGYCLPETGHHHNLPGERWNMSHTAIIVEAGQPIELISLLQLTWSQRLQVMISLTTLLGKLETSVLGPIAITDFRRQQFVFQNEATEVRLVDLDDLSTEEPSCNHTEDCCRLVRISNPTAVCSLVVCDAGRRCKGYNYLHNLQKSNEVFFTKLLPYSVPDYSKSDASELLKEISQLNITASNIGRVLKKMKHDHSRYEIS